MIVFLKALNAGKKARSLLTAVVLCCYSVSVFADNVYKVDNSNSKVTFTGDHVGMTFSGIFEKWQANLVLPPAENSHIHATFQLKSAKTGNFTYDTTLAEGDWFDTKNYPTGHFTSQTVEVTSNGYKVIGNLELRGLTKPQTFLLERNGNKLTGQFTIKRLDYGIGLESDPQAEWVGKNIEIRLSLRL